MGTFIRIFLTSLCLLVCVVYFDAAYLKGWPFKGWSRADIGVFGDAWGFMTSIFSVAAFFGVLISIKYQINAFKQSEVAANNQFNSLVLQNFESNLFRMLDLLQSLIQDMDIKNIKKDMVLYSGRDIFKYFYVKKFKKQYSILHPAGTRDEHDCKTCIQASFQRLYKVRQQDLGHYFRFLYNIFRYIHTSDISDAHKLTYSKVVRSQLSNYELMIIYYNCFSSYGSKFEFFAIKYQLFDNLPIDELVIPFHQCLMDPEAFGENPDFDPVYARSTM